MNPYYKQSVLLLGGVLPLVLVVALLGVVFHYRGKLEETYKQRKNNYAKVLQKEEERKALEEKVNSQRPHLERWDSLLNTPSSTYANELIGAAQKRYKGKEFALTSFRQSGNGGSIGVASKQDSVKLDLAFRGTFSALQNTFLELETKMPQLQLDELSLAPNGNVLNAKVIYSAWEKNEK